MKKRKERAIIDITDIINKFLLDVIKNSPVTQEKEEARRLYTIIRMSKSGTIIEKPQKKGGK